MSRYSWEELKESFGLVGAVFFFFFFFLLDFFPQGIGASS